MEKRRIGAADEFSKLPEEILEQIMSLLVVKDAARMATLAKVWNRLWTSLPYLNFGDNLFPHSLCVEGEPLDFDKVEIAVEKLFIFVDQTLANRLNNNISLHKFWIEVPFHGSSSRIHNWITTLVASNIKELNLIVPRPLESYNPLPEAIFTAKALSMLTLGGFKLELSPHHGIQFSTLRELNIIKSFLDQQFIQALLASCSFLEVLYLQNFHGLVSLQVSGTTSPRLKKVRLEFCPSEFEMLDIASPYLEDLYVSSVRWELKAIQINSCKALKSLGMNGVSISEQWLEDLFSSLPNLETFHLFSCNTVKTLKISSNRLKYLTVMGLYNLIGAELNTPNLLTFSCSLDILSTFELKASGLLTASFMLPQETLDSHWYLNLTKFLTNFNGSRAIDLQCHHYEAIVIPKEMRENLLPLLYHANCLHVYIPKCLDYVDVVDGLLWISPQLDTLSFHRAPDLKTLKFIYDDASVGDEKPPCCALLPWKCWRHKLKKVKLQNFTYEEKHELINYFFTNADMFEMIEVLSGYNL